MDINTLVKLTNQKLAGETLLYSQLEPYFDDVIDKINTELNAIFPTFSEHRERNQTDSGIPAYTYFPDMYIRSVVVVGAAVGFTVGATVGSSVGAAVGTVTFPSIPVTSKFILTVFIVR